ncbi:type VII secretion protein EssA [Bacillus sp. NPDC077027]|uniref:type VII secretion protein EssA n=1 Tax=Bacillus sp. NPDC077027 TaxID=3390548 RepID=UPI003CFF98AE
MKLKLLLKGIALSVISFFLLLPAALADTGEDTDTNVKPNEYKEKELHINSGILRDQAKYEQSKSTSKVKANIDFREPSKAPGASLAPDLFSDLKENPPKTAASIMSDMNISFSDSATTTLSHEAKQTSSILSVMFAVLIVIGLVAMAILIPKVNAKAEKK